MKNISWQTTAAFAGIVIVFHLCFWSCAIVTTDPENSLYLEACMVKVKIVEDSRWDGLIDIVHTPSGFRVRLDDHLGNMGDRYMTYLPPRYCRGELDESTDITDYPGILYQAPNPMFNEGSILRWNSDTDHWEAQGDGTLEFKNIDGTPIGETE